jgi:TRAP-type C4-dicarboxylate transport system substrate-binding protein
LKKYLLCFLPLLLTGSIVLGGCAEKAPGPTTEGPIELKVSTWGPPELPISKVNEEWAEIIEKQSGGRVKFTFYWEQSLVKASDTWKAIQTGITDIGYYVLGFSDDPTLHALNGFTSLPFMGWEDMQMATDIYHEIFPKFPELEAEFKGTKLLWICNMPPNQIHSVNNEVRVPADYQGMKVITSGGLAKIAANAGAATITSMGPSDWKISLERGLAESIMVHWPAISGYDLIPLFNYHTDFGDAGISMAMHGMWANETVWNKLPEDIQKIILDNSPWIEDKYISIDEAEIVKATNEAKKLGHTFATLNQDEIEEWKKTAESVTLQWIEETEDMGLPARAVYDEVKRLIREYKRK